MAAAAETFDPELKRLLKNIRTLAIENKHVLREEWKRTRLRDLVDNIIDSYHANTLDINRFQYCLTAYNLEHDLESEYPESIKTALHELVAYFSKNENILIPLCHFVEFKCCVLSIQIEPFVPELTIDTPLNEDVIRQLQENLRDKQRLLFTIVKSALDAVNDENFLVSFIRACIDMRFQHGIKRDSHILNRHVLDKYRAGEISAEQYGILTDLIFLGDNKRPINLIDWISFCRENDCLELLARVLLDNKAYWEQSLHNSFISHLPRSEIIRAIGELYPKSEDRYQVLGFYCPLDSALGEEGLEFKALYDNRDIPEVADYIRGWIKRRYENNKEFSIVIQNAWTVVTDGVRQVPEEMKPVKLWLKQLYNQATFSLRHPQRKQALLLRHAHCFTGESATLNEHQSTVIGASVGDPKAKAELVALYDAYRAIRDSAAGATTPAPGDS